MKGKPDHDRDEREIPPPKADQGMQETDDHVMGQAPRARTQAVDDLEVGVGDEHVKSPSQGVRPER